MLWVGRCARVEAAGRRRVSRDGTEAPFARLRTPLLCYAAREAASLPPLCAGVTARLAAGVLPPEVVRGGWVAVFLTRKKQTAGICLLSLRQAVRRSYCCKTLTSSASCAVMLSMLF